MEENQKLTQMGRLTSSIRFVDVSEKECQVSIDEYYTVMVIKRDTTPPIQINLNDIKSAKILPKVQILPCRPARPSGPQTVLSLGET